MPIRAINPAIINAEENPLVNDRKTFKFSDGFIEERSALNPSERIVKVINNVDKAIEIKFAVVRVSCKSADITLLFSMGNEPIIALVLGAEKTAHPAPEIDSPIIIRIGLEFIVKLESMNADKLIKAMPNIDIHFVPNLSDNLPEKGLIIAIKKADDIKSSPDKLVLYSKT